MKGKMTKEQALKIFREEFADILEKYRGDSIAKREAWSNFTDSLCKGGEITQSQYDRWSNPF